MREAKILVIASSYLMNTSKSLLGPDVIMLTRTNLDWMQPTSVAMGVQLQTKMNPIMIVFASIKD